MREKNDTGYTATICLNGQNERWVISDIRWIGGAAATAQVQSYLFGGTWESTDRIQVQIGVKIYDFAAASTVIATIIDNLVTAWSALDASSYPEFAEITPTRSTSTLVLTANSPGKTFVCTLTPLESNGGAADAQTIEGAGTATTGTATTASAGPQHWDTAANWSGGVVPATGDSVFLENSDDDIKFGLAQSGVTLALLEMPASFTGTLGLPLFDQDSTEYPEYRTRALTISATVLNVGSGDGSCSGRILINVGTAACTLTVRGTAGGLDENLEALHWKGTHASNVVNIYAGSVAIAGFATETATVTTLRINDGVVRCGNVSLATVIQHGGTLVLNQSATTLTINGGTLALIGSGAHTTLTNHAGTVLHATTGTITNYVGGPGSTLDKSANFLAATITNCTLHAGASLNDPAGVFVFTNPIALTRCRLSDVAIEIGVNRNLAVT